MSRKRDWDRKISDASVAFDYPPDGNVGIMDGRCVVRIGRDRILIQWDRKVGEDVTPYLFRGTFKRLGMLAVFDASGDPSFETMAIPYIQGAGYCYLDRVKRDGQRRLFKADAQTQSDSVR